MAHKGAFELARTKQAHRERYASGRAKPDRSPAKMHRILAVASKERYVQAMGTTVARLTIIDGYLTQSEADAAAFYFDHRVAFMAANGTGDPNPSAQDLTATRGYSEGMSAEKARKMRSRFERTIRPNFNERELDTMDRFIICNQWAEYSRRAELKAALGKLSKVMAQIGR